MRELIEAFSAKSEERMRSTLASDMTAYVTNASGGVDRVQGRDGYIERLLGLQAPHSICERDALGYGCARSGSDDG